MVVDSNINLAIEAGLLSQIGKLAETYAEDPLIMESLLLLILHITSTHASAAQELAKY